MDSHREAESPVVVERCEDGFNHSSPFPVTLPVENHIVSDQGTSRKMGILKRNEFDEKTRVMQYTDTTPLMLDSSEDLNSPQFHRIDDATTV